MRISICTSTQTWWSFPAPLWTWGLLPSTHPRDSVGRPEHRLFNPHLPAATPWCLICAVKSVLGCGCVRNKGAHSPAALAWRWPARKFKGCLSSKSTQDRRQSLYCLFKKDWPTFQPQASLSRQEILFCPTSLEVMGSFVWHRFVSWGAGRFTLAVTAPPPQKCSLHHLLILVTLGLWTKERWGIRYLSLLKQC